MKTIRFAIAAAIAAVLTMVGATAAQAYPDPVIKISVNNQSFTGGKVLKFEVTSGDVDCQWVITFNGQKRTGSGTSISGSFSTPKVGKVTKKSLEATCTYEDGSSTGDSNSGVAGKAVASDSAVITLLPAGTSNATVSDAALPDTGGSNAWILIVGGLLVVVGGAAIYASRRNA